ncbi:Nicotinamide-nucleotide amidohydrolase PncC [Rosistilla carotiformis]|uniref:Nicotinamide-nucleotide amidohydrolase PncC n=1 Tax=Rosistilla carotiformis TaxID=2528017 RepID=A0A518JRQ6_9BACT|nr:CinA family protein [Rosistilla carotiformis]QDV68239.1 Nicotinamide-nucleotide amidohydrolase PncC [Rosistilla carotiformis]
MIPLAQRVADRLTEQQTKIVFAESCTAGLVAATLASIPGISRWLCGSVVTYRESMKRVWLGVDEADLLRFTAVSPPVTEQMAAGVLGKTGDADLAAAITGHLGPDAPPELDGIVFVSIARRRSDGSLEIETSRHQLKTATRTDRQREAVDCLLADLLKRL